MKRGFDEDVVEAKEIPADTGLTGQGSIYDVLAGF